MFSADGLGELEPESLTTKATRLNQTTSMEVAGRRVGHRHSPPSPPGESHGRYGEPPLGIGAPSPSLKLETLVALHLVLQFSFPNDSCFQELPPRPDFMQLNCGRRTMQQHTTQP